MSASSLLHYPDGAKSSTLNSSVSLERNSPKTLGISTAVGTGTTTIQNARLSAASSVTDPNSAQDLVPKSSSKPSSDTTDGGSLALSSAKFPFEGRKGAVGEYGDSHGATGSTHVGIDGTEIFTDSLSRSVKNNSRTSGNTIKPGQGVCMFTGINGGNSGLNIIMYNESYNFI